jgi:hypothetical protein
MEIDISEGTGRKMKNREEWRLIVQEAKAHPELYRGEGREEGRKEY